MKTPQLLTPALQPAPLVQAAEFLERGFGFGVAPDHVAEVAKNLRDFAELLASPEWRQLSFALGVHPGMLPALSLVAGERARQVEFERFTPLDDDKYSDGELRNAAAAYLLPHLPGGVGFAPSMWPWPDDWFKPKDDGRDTTRGAALAVAELERQARQAQA